MSTGNTKNKNNVDELPSLGEMPVYKKKIKEVGKHGIRRTYY